MDELHPIKVAALYRFVAFDAPEELQPRIQAQCAAGGIKGTILLAHEGINGTVAGNPSDIDALIAFLRDIPGCAELDVKYSVAKDMPFYRMKVRLKKEIVTLGVEGIDPKREVGTYVQPEDWNALISDPDTVLIDTRNDYEVAIGTFEGAVDPRTKSFSEFPDWFRAHRAELAAGKTKFAMFCTGGIRCEKSTAFLKAEGIDEVYHLEGGILRYLENIPEAQSKWQGECFVFDERVSVKHGLELGEMELCHACRRPISQEDKASVHFVEGVSCPACYAERSEEDRDRFAERQKQIALAKKRGKQHIGFNPRDDR
ncbi:rhodanese-related sulfurtransferase [Sphingorhabdus sp. EL138]|uniref:oxygen-dependent tRNA uridine(34) hydroxylase TrhO n=1 Tax=Sphingorhabdus sp. EL138 TaxID=2073156 RepID=UPI0025E11E5C|nr:rhodanese-related sulfurtransferase [Sphingorhabdus sp. EL138]